MSSDVQVNLNLLVTLVVCVLLSVNLHYLPSLCCCSLSLLILFIMLSNVGSPVLWVPSHARSATRMAYAELAKDERLTSFRSEWLLVVLLYLVWTILPGFDTL